MIQHRVLVVVTSHDRMGDFGRPTGYWLGEVTHFHEALAKEGFEIDVVSPQGGKPPVDPKSLSRRDKVSITFQADPRLSRKLENTLTPEQVDPDAYQAIYYAGGHGAMWDLADNKALAELASHIYESGKLVSAVCHGSAGLLNITVEGDNLIQGRRVTGFANLEERLIRLTKVVPFLLEDELRAQGGEFSKARLPFVSHVVSDARVISGQNPQSARAVGETLARSLSGFA